MMMCKDSELNLPKKYWALWNFIQRSLENQTVRHQGEIKRIFITVEEVLYALSDARDEIHKKDCMIGDLIKRLEL